MSDSAEKKLTQSRLRKLFAAAGNRQTDANSKIKAKEYDWLHPRAFTDEQLAHLDNFNKGLADEIAEKFSQICRNSFEAEMVSCEQHFGGVFKREQMARSDNIYFVGFGLDGQEPTELLGIPAITGFSWVTQLLGENSSEENEDKDFSQLEESLILDIAEGLVEAFSVHYEDRRFKPVKRIVKRQMPVELDETGEYCCITFSVGQAGAEKNNEAYYLVRCEQLESMVGKEPEIKSDFSSEELYHAMLEHVKQMSITLIARLDCSMFSFRQVMNLKSGDVLLLDKRVDEPVNVLAQDHKVFEGSCAKFSGKYAVVITDYIV